MNHEDALLGSGAADELDRFDSLLRRLELDQPHGLAEYGVDFADLLVSLSGLVQQLEGMAAQQPDHLSVRRLEWMRDEIVYHVPAHLANVVAALTLMLAAREDEPSRNNG